MDSLSIEIHRVASLNRLDRQFRPAGRLRGGILWRHAQRRRADAFRPYGGGGLVHFPIPLGSSLCGKCSALCDGFANLVTALMYLRFGLPTVRMCAVVFDT